MNLLNGWGETIDEDGYFFYTNDCNAHHYSYEKIMSGLVDLYVYAEVEEAADYLAKITRWAEKHLLRTRKPASNASAPYSVGRMTRSKESIPNGIPCPKGTLSGISGHGDVRYKKEFARVWHLH